MSNVNLHLYIFVILFFMALYSICWLDEVVSQSQCYTLTFTHSYSFISSGLSTWIHSFLRSLALPTLERFVLPFHALRLSWEHFLHLHSSLPLPSSGKGGPGLFPQRKSHQSIRSVIDYTGSRKVRRTHTHMLYIFIHVQCEELFGCLALLVHILHS